MKHAVLLCLILIFAIFGWRLASGSHRTYVTSVFRRYVVPALLIIAAVATVFAFFVTHPTLQIL